MTANKTDTNCCALIKSGGCDNGLKVRMIKMKKQINGLLPNNKRNGLNKGALLLDLIVGAGVRLKLIVQLVKRG